jgi:hypothetical protein
MLMSGKKQTIMGYIKVSTLSSIINVFLNTPIWLVSTRLTLKQDPDITSCVVSIYQNEGMAGFFKGLGPTMMLITNPIIQYVTFEWIKIVLKHDKRSLSAFKLFLIGAGAKLLSTCVTYPL